MRKCAHCEHVGNDVRATTEGVLFCSMCRQVRKERSGRRDVSQAWRETKRRQRRTPQPPGTDNQA